VMVSTLPLGRARERLWPLSIGRRWKKAGATIGEWDCIGANLPVFHSMLLASAMASRSLTRRRRISVTGGVRVRLLDRGDAQLRQVALAVLLGTAPDHWPGALVLDRAFIHAKS
jgi:hypothetical protein